MNDAGYTLTETLAALAVLGMALGGLSLSAQVIGAQQLATGKAVKQQQAARGVQARLERLLAAGAPFASQQPDRLSGDAQGFQFVCGRTAPCAAQILSDPQGARLQVSGGSSASDIVSLPLPQPARLVYRGARTTGDVWPPSGPGGQPLRSVLLLQTTRNGDVPVVAARVWAEQPSQCAFDSVSQECR